MSFPNTTFFIWFSEVDRPKLEEIRVAQDGTKLNIHIIHTFWFPYGN
jgi:hypothetical protein